MVNGDLPPEEWVEPGAPEPPADVTAPHGASWQAPDDPYAPGQYSQPPVGVAWAAPPRRRRTGLIVAFSITAAVIVLGALAAVIGVRSNWTPAAARSHAVTPSPVPTSRAPSPTPEPR